MNSYNRISYEAEPADTSRAGKQVRIVKRCENNSFELAAPEYVATLDVEQALDLRESLTEVIDNA